MHLLISSTTIPSKFSIWVIVPTIIIDIHRSGQWLFARVGCPFYSSIFRVLLLLLILFRWGGLRWRFDFWRGRGRLWRNSSSGRCWLFFVTTTKKKIISASRLSLKFEVKDKEKKKLKQGLRTTSLWRAHHHRRNLPLCSDYISTHTNTHTHTHKLCDSPDMLSPYSSLVVGVGRSRLSSGGDGGADWRNKRKKFKRVREKHPTSQAWNFLF